MEMSVSGGGWSSSDEYTNWRCEIGWIFLDLCTGEGHWRLGGMDETEGKRREMKRGRKKNGRKKGGKRAI